MLSARVFYFRFKSVLPGVLREVTVPPRDQEAHLVICKEIQELILTQAFVRVDDFPSLCFSPIFVIPKKSGDLRVILDLKKIHVFISVSFSEWKLSMSDCISNEERQNIPSFQVLIPALTASPIKDDPDSQ